MLYLSPTRLSRGHAMVERRVTVVPHDVILLDDGASAVDLEAAVRMLGDLRVRYGDPPQRNLRAVVRNYRPAPGWKGGRDDAEHREKVHNLAHAPLRDVPGIGRVRRMPIFISRPSAASGGKPE